MQQTLLFRAGNLDQENELAIACKYFNVERLRSLVPDDSLIIGRYSVLPFYKELTEDLATCGSHLINSLAEHEWISGFHYYQDLKDYTPKSWDESEFYKSGYDGPLFLKGRTNSRKAQWGKGCYAPNRQASYEIASVLANDPLIGPQGIIYREYVPLKVFEHCPIYGTPFANEWRLFWYKDKLLSVSYYWTNASDETIAKAEFGDKGLAVARAVANIAKDRTTFFVTDVAETASGEWILIEINDGQMSGIPEDKAPDLYANLAMELANDHF